MSYSLSNQETSDAHKPSSPTKIDQDQDQDQDQVMTDAKYDDDNPPSYEDSSNKVPGLPPIQIPLPRYNQPLNSSSSSTSLPPGQQLPIPISNGSPSPQITEDLVAAEALTRLNGTPPPQGNGIATPMSNLSIEERQHPLINKVNQVSRHPIVRDAFKYYETSKRNYPHFNYAAGIVEGVALPVVNRIELNLNNRHRQRQYKKKRRMKSKNDKTETKKRLQFCLHLLRLANDQITNHVNFLQTKIAEREVRPESSANNNDIVENNDNNFNEKNDDDLNNEKDEQINVDANSVGLTPTTSISGDSSAASASTNPPVEVAQQTKTEIITTVKKIIHVISNFKTSSLTNDSINTATNNELKSTIRDIILKLPSQIQQTTLQNNNSAQQANDKILLFAKDSLDMIGRLTNVFNDQLQKAEDWIGDDNAVNDQRNGTNNSNDQSPDLPHQSSPQPFNGNSFGDNKIQS